MTVILITGPARSGKSRFAEQLADRSQRPVIYIATSPPPDPEGDREWYDRIQKHRLRRPDTWQTLEISLDLATGIRQSISSDRCGLVDSLGSWVANGLELESRIWEEQVGDLLTQLHQCKGWVILVAEEVGWGVVPAYPMGRAFRDRLGELVQQVGAMADQVYLVSAGYALDLKQLGMLI